MAASKRARNLIKSVELKDPLAELAIEFFQARTIDVIADHQTGKIRKSGNQRQFCLIGLPQGTGPQSDHPNKVALTTHGKKKLELGVLQKIHKLGQLG